MPGIGFSPDKMLLGRVFAYADTHRYRIGPNYQQLPVNRHRVEGAYTYQFDGPMAYDHTGDRPKYAPNSYGAPYSDLTGPAEDGWETDGEMVRQAYTLRAEDDDFGQAGTLVNEVWDDDARERFVGNVAGHLARWRQRVRARAGLRVLEERRRRDRQAHRGGGPRGPARDVAPHPTEATRDRLTPAPRTTTRPACRAGRRRS